MAQGSLIQNLPTKLQFMLLQFLNICFLYHPLLQTALQFIHTLGLTIPFPNTLIYQCSHHTRITKPAKTSMAQINQKGLSSQNWYWEPSNSVNKGKAVRTSFLLCTHRAPLGDTLCWRRSLGWESTFATAHSAAVAKPLPTILSNNFPCLPK